MRQKQMKITLLAGVIYAAAAMYVMLMAEPYRSY